MYKHRKYNRSLQNPLVKVLIVSIVIFLATLTSVLIHYIRTNKSQSDTCFNLSSLTFDGNESQVLKGIVNNKETSCFQFAAESNQVLKIISDTKLFLVTPQKQVITVWGSFEIPITENGSYLIRVEGERSPKQYKVEIGLLNAVSGKTPASSSLPSSQPSVPQATPQLVPVLTDPLAQLSYNVKHEPSFRKDDWLQTIVDEAVFRVQAKGLSTNNLSISLVDLRSSPCCAYAFYSDQVPRFPASISKLFWLVALFGRIQAGVPLGEPISDAELYSMIQDSDNNPASRVLDQLTDTESGGNLSPEEIKIWSEKRLWVNHYFERAGYQDINVSQKNFPIPKLGLKEPQGRDLQIRGTNPSQPLRNYLTTYAVSRLLFEIEQEQAISREYSQKMKQLLQRDYIKEQQKQYDSIKGFIGEGLAPEEVVLFSKPGWTASSRQDATIIASQDGRVRYILVVFGDDSKFAEDWGIFPEISRMVYERMVK